MNSENFWTINWYYIVAVIIGLAGIVLSFLNLIKNRKQKINNKEKKYSNQNQIKKIIRNQKITIYISVSLSLIVVISSNWSKIFPVNENTTSTEIHTIDTTIYDLWLGTWYTIETGKNNMKHCSQIYFSLKDSVLMGIYYDWNNRPLQLEGRLSNKNKNCAGTYKNVNTSQYGSFNFTLNEDKKHFNGIYFYKGSSNSWIGSRNKSEINCSTKSPENENKNIKEEHIYLPLILKGKPLSKEYVDKEKIWIIRMIKISDVDYNTFIKDFKKIETDKYMLTFKKDEDRMELSMIPPWICYDIIISMNEAKLTIITTRN